jgi:[glutamine synthetase] adenylyltransferase / [glutamine synthetase]-adenylyl-L-tyrosine phosphorylase
MLPIRFLTSQLNILPSGFENSVKPSVESWLASLEQNNLTLNPIDKLIQSLPKVWCCSQFVAESCTRKPELLVDLVNSGDLAGLYSKNTYQVKLASLTIADEAELMVQLRNFRRREMVRIA